MSDLVRLSLIERPLRYPQPLLVRRVDLALALGQASHPAAAQGAVD